uniref:NB-ARC domain-containing protein n=1 Tax=Oryza barthii TaxID=65489 RepID=A0A0D3G5S3_9ORYZ
MSGMEAAVASGLLKIAGNKLVSLIGSEFAAIARVAEDLSELQGIHREITSWLSIVRDQSRECDLQFRWVINKLMDIAYDIEDLLHEVQLESEKHKIHTDGDKHAIFDRNSISEEWSVLSNNVDESQIPIRDKVKDEIVYELVDSNEVKNFEIVSVVGLGGSGKITLAKHICHVNKIKESFNDRIFWVHVSQEFNVKKLIGKLYETVVCRKSDYQAEKQMIREISKELSGNKFLLVLDDAWHTDVDEWKQFMLHLKDRSPGSRVLLTTRHRKVAEAVESDHTYELVFLSESESWSLFLKYSGWVEDDLGSEFIQVGKEILKRCGGVPLAIRTIEGVLRKKREIRTWRAIRGSDLWNDGSINDRAILRSLLRDRRIALNDKVFASLKLSYIHLADELKQCFTFCSIFPKGYVINKDRLVAQWIAHGFITPMKEEQPEDIASEYFNSLVKAGFFLQDTLKGFDNSKLLYKMHDLIHDLAQYCEKNEAVTSGPKNMTTDQTYKCRYLSLTSGTEKVKMGLLDKVRALYMSDGNLSFDKPDKKSCYVRSVVFDSENFTPFPLVLLKFEYLGYLEIHQVDCERLPEAISGCWNLQSLHLIMCNRLMLPESIGKLKKLRALELNTVLSLKSLPQSIGDCQNLRSLQLHKCFELRDIPTSIGKIENLKVLHIEPCSSLQQLPSEPCREFNNLQISNLAYCRCFHDLPSTFACCALRTLNLNNTKITMLPQWVTLNDTLECLDLGYCNELMELPKGITNLRRLAVLNLEGCNKLRCMPSGFRQLTRLTKLGLFVVGCGGDDARISELETLDMLSGDIKITNLKYMQDPTDADRASLKRKNNIKRLVLNWYRGETEKELVSNMVMEQDMAVLNALEPPSKIEEISIHYFGGPCLPQWMRKQTDSSCWEGTMLMQTSPCQLLYLTRITLEEIPNLKHIQGLFDLPLLNYLQLFGLPNLEDMWTTTTGSEIRGDELQAQYCFPVLTTLSIEGCPRLNVVPHFPSSLEELSLKESNEQLLSTGSFSHLVLPLAHKSDPCSSAHSAVPRLKNLFLTKMTVSSCGWKFLQYLDALERLHIFDNDDLTQLPESMRSLTSLQNLYIHKCPTFGMLPEWFGELCSLRYLNITGTPMMDSHHQSIGHLTSLTNLTIECDNLKQLPETFQHLTSLRTLGLVGCGALTALPECIGKLSALHQLIIQQCSSIQCLPESIKHLTNLQGLYIYGCPYLAKRYKQGMGEYWQLVSHIPNLRI